ncbi:MAG: hypothetical protein RLY93_21060 [Sumerlaeia bacterium]
MDAQKQIAIQVSPSQIGSADSWLPALHCGLSGRVSGISDAAWKLGERANVFEGFRNPADPKSEWRDVEHAKSPLYRQGNVSAFRIEVDGDHWQRPIVSGDYCVHPDDVLVSRIPPVRASIVTTRHHRHPIDPQLFCVRGLSLAEGVWATTLLNSAEYEAYLVASSASQALPRVSLRALRKAPVPQVPEVATRWASSVLLVLGEMVANQERLFRLQEEVENAVDGLAAGVESKAGTRLWSRVPAPALTADSWVPAHVESNAALMALADAGWCPLVDLVRQSPTIRLKSWPQEAQGLSLADVSRYFIPEEEQSAPGTRPGRYYATPVKPGDVLMSTLVSSPKVAYADISTPAYIHAVDLWARLQFRETSGAYALMLGCSSVRDELRHLAVGTAQQFATASSLLRLCLPPVDRETRERWHRRLEDVLLERRRLEKQFRDLRLEGRRMVAEALNIPWSEMKARPMK